jgi:dTDP-4-dehydrorhamnose reductase
MRILITGGNGNIATIIKNNLSDFYDITSPSRSELNVSNTDNIKTFLNNKLYKIEFY